MSAMASQTTGVLIVYSTVCSGADQRKHQSSASLAFVRGIHRWPVHSPHQGLVTRKMLPFYHVIMKRCHNEVDGYPNCLFSILSLIMYPTFYVSLANSLFEVRVWMNDYRKCLSCDYLSMPYTQSISVNIKKHPIEHEQINHFLRVLWQTHI